jgi:hypothetical protein
MINAATDFLDMKSPDRPTRQLDLGIAALTGSGSLAVQLDASRTFFALTA